MLHHEARNRESVWEMKNETTLIILEVGPNVSIINGFPEIPATTECF